jgi:hypothetical protein
VSTLEVDCGDRLGLGGQELLPSGGRASWCGVDAGFLEDFPDGGGRDLVPEPREPAADPPVAQVGLSRAISSASRRIAGPVRGRPGVRRGYVQWRLTSSACQRRSVRGVMIRASWRRCAVESRRVRAARTARSAQVSRGELTWRCRTAIWWRSTRISVFLSLSDGAAGPASRTAARGSGKAGGRSRKLIVSESELTRC